MTWYTVALTGSVYISRQTRKTYLVAIGPTAVIRSSANPSVVLGRADAALQMRRISCSRAVHSRTYTLPSLTNQKCRRLAMAL